MNATTEKTLQALVIEDSPSDFTIIEDILSRMEGTHVVLNHTNNLTEGLEIARIGRFDIVILDLDLPDSSGFETFTAFRTELPDVPVLILTGNTDEVAELRAFQDGAQDYLRKNELQPELLSRSILHGVERSRFSGELQRRADELARSEARTRAIIDASLDPMFIINSDRELLFTNPAARHMVDGLDQDLLHILPVFDLSSGGVREVEVESRDGADRRAIEMRVVELQWNEAPARMAVLRDVTELRRSIIQLREQALLLDGATDGIIVRDLNYKIKYWNRGATRIFGYEKDEVTGHELDLYISPEGDGADVQTAWSHTLERGEWSGELQGKDRGLRRLVLACRMSLLRDTEGAPRSILEIITNVTERRALEMQVLRSQRLESLGVLAGGIAHDFNNILSVIMGNLTLAKLQSDVDSEIYKKLDAIQGASEHARDLVRRILIFSRPRIAESSATQPEGVIMDAVKLLRSGIPANIQIDLEFARPLPLVRAEATQIEQIILNLGTNAAHAIGSRSGNIRIFAEVVRVDPEDIPFRKIHASEDYVRLTVHDNGCGMDSRTRERVFEPFFTTKKPGEGTGLGLSVVHGIVESQGGFITLESEPGHGTTFYLYLQIAKEKSVAPDAVLHEPSPPSVFAPATPGCRVLFLDDDSSIVKISVAMLEHAGCHVSAFDDPLRALEAFRAAPAEFDIVVTDAAMPNLSGCDFAAELLKMRPALPVILVSGFLRDEELERARRIGIARVLPKPYSWKTLLELVKTETEKAR